MSEHYAPLPYESANKTIFEIDCIEKYLEFLKDKLIQQLEESDPQPKLFE
jgi:hypothetical protein